MNKLERICVFCGSGCGRHRDYVLAARAMGRLIADQDLVLIYGAGSAGLMGELARAALAGGARVIGVIPRRIHEMVEPLELSELHVVESMHARKAMMYEMSDAFVVLPGGIGTVEEFFEVYTWIQLGIHLKPIGLLNIHGYFDKLLGFVEHMVAEGFLKSAHGNVLVVEERPETLIAQLQAKELVYIDKLG